MYCNGNLKTANASFRTLKFSKLPITQTKSRFPFPVKNYIFTFDFSNQFEGSKNLDSTE